jgi:2-methylisocitrate lyase-like PEP mutase family enzyme
LTVEVEVRKSLVPAMVSPHYQLMDNDQVRSRFLSLHAAGSFLMPNPHDVGSCRLLTALGFEALATTSGGFAMSMGRPDMTTSRTELVEHVRAICSATELPVNVDSEQCFPNDAGGVSETVELLAAAGAAGCSIEDWDPRAEQIEELDVAVSRVAAAAAAADRHGLVLTARAENHLRGRDDLDDTIRRLSAYRDAGAKVVYAPALTELTAIARVVNEVGAPVNALLMPGGPSSFQLADAGVRRVSVGGSLARIAYGALARAAEHFKIQGVIPADSQYLDRDLASRAFSHRGLG